MLDVTYEACVLKCSICIISWPLPLGLQVIIILLLDIYRMPRDSERRNRSWMPYDPFFIKKKHQNLEFVIVWAPNFPLPYILYNTMKKKWCIKDTLFFT